jgi:hypothetical protein
MDVLHYYKERKLSYECFRKILFIYVVCFMCVCGHKKKLSKDNLQWGKM